MIPVKKYMLTINNEIICTDLYRVMWSPAGEPDWFCFDSYEGFERINGWSSQKTQIIKSSDNITDLIEVGDIIGFQEPNSFTFTQKVYKGDVSDLENPNLCHIRKFDPEGKKIYIAELIELDDDSKIWDFTESLNERLIGRYASDMNVLQITLKKNEVNFISIDRNHVKLDELKLITDYLRNQGYEVVFVDKNVTLKQMTKEELISIRNHFNKILDEVEKYETN